MNCHSRTMRWSVIFLAALVAISALLTAQTPAKKPDDKAAPSQPPTPVPITSDDLNQLTWRWIGPVDFSGRITEFAVPRGQVLTYYVLTASGGLWKTEDAGIHFEPIFDKYGNMSMGYLAVA
ncbi:MAG: glycosyl hydrolase, partial [Candidatus Aminicenantales bacterium]